MEIRPKELEKEAAKLTKDYKDLIADELVQRTHSLPFQQQMAKKFNENVRNLHPKLRQQVPIFVIFTLHDGDSLKSMTF